MGYFCRHMPRGSSSCVTEDKKLASRTWQGTVINMRYLIAVSCCLRCYQSDRAAKPAPRRICGLTAGPYVFGVRRSEHGAQAGKGSLRARSHSTLAILNMPGIRRLRGSSSWRSKQSSDGGGPGAHSLAAALMLLPT